MARHRDLDDTFEDDTESDDTLEDDGAIESLEDFWDYYDDDYDYDYDYYDGAPDYGETEG